MAEVLGLVSGIAGLFSLTIQLLETGTEFVSDFKGAPKFGKAYFDEVQLLQQVLKNLKSRLDDEDIRTFLTNRSQNGSINSLEAARDSVKKCTGELQSLLNALKTYNVTGISSWEKFKWHFKKSDLREELNRLQTYRMMILDDFNNMLAVKTASTIKDMTNQQGLMSTKLESSLENVESTKQSTETILAKINSFRNDIEELQSNTRDIKHAIDRIEETSHRVNRIVTTASQEQTLLRNLGQSSAKNVLEVMNMNQSSFDLEILQWLSQADPSTNHDSARSLHAADTGVWLIETDEYKKWKDRPGQLLWLHGKAGSGKTILCSTVIEDLNANLDDSDIRTNVAYFYFDFRTSTKQTSNGMLRSLLRQLLSLLPEVPKPIRDLFQKSMKTGHQPRQTELMNLMSDIISACGRSYIVIDALDECSEREDAIDLLLQLGQICADNAMLFVTSRREVEIEEAFSELSEDQILMMDIESTKLTDDIEKLLQIRLFHDRKFRRWGEHRSIILKTLLNGAGGMFQWVICQLDTLSKCRTLPELESCLSSLPQSLDATYERILLNICDQDITRAKTAIEWLAFNFASESELTLDELAEASMLNPNLPFDVSNRLLSSREILSVLSALVSTHETAFGTTMIRLAHSSVKEFFLSNRIRDSPCHHFSISETSSHLNIASACLQYLLSFDKFESLSENVRQDFPLLGYTTDLFLGHCQAAFSSIESDRLLTLCLRLLDTRNPAYKAWLRRLWRDNKGLTSNPPSNIDDAELPMPTLYAAASNIVPLLEALIKRGEHVEPSSTTSQSPLQAAADLGHFEVARILIENKADINRSTPTWPDTPLQGAAQHGHNQMVRLLLENNADVNQRTSSWPHTALRCSIIFEHVDIASLLIQFGAIIDWDTFSDIATARKQQMLSDILLQAALDTDVEKLGNNLHHAAKFGLDEVGRVLLENGSDPNHRDLQQKTPLMKTVSSGAVTFALLLLQFGADPNMMNEEETPLILAIQEQNLELANLLLEWGADMDLVHPVHGTPLMYAAKNCEEAFVMVLLDDGASATTTTTLAKQPNGTTNALLAAIQDSEGDATAYLLLTHPMTEYTAYTQLQAAIWAALTLHCRTSTRGYVVALFKAVQLGSMLGLLPDSAADMPEHGGSLTTRDTTGQQQHHPPSLTAWARWALQYIGCDECEPAMALAAETDDSDTLCAMLEYGVSPPPKFVSELLHTAEEAGNAKVAGFLRDFFERLPET